MEFTRYWLERFPLLLIHVWGTTQNLKSELNLSNYYHNDFSFPVWNYDKICDRCVQEQNLNKEPIKIVYLSKSDKGESNLEIDNYKTNYKTEKSGWYARQNAKLNKTVQNGSPGKRHISNKAKYKEMNHAPLVWTIPTDTMK